MKQRQFFWKAKRSHKFPAKETSINMEVGKMWLS